MPTEYFSSWNKHRQRTIDRLHFIRALYPVPRPNPALSLCAKHCLQANAEHQLPFSDACALALPVPTNTKLTDSAGSSTTSSRPPNPSRCIVAITGAIGPPGKGAQHCCPLPVQRVPTLPAGTTNELALVVADGIAASARACVPLLSRFRTT